MRSPSRRTVLASGTALIGLVSGCIGSNSNTSPEGRQSLPAPMLGDPEADVTVAVYEDYACPHCAKYSLHTFPILKEEYIDSGRIRYEFHDFPIPVHERWSWDVAEAARAVQARSNEPNVAYFEYSKRLFKHQSEYSIDLLRTLADGVGVEGEGVVNDVTDDTYRPVVRSDRQRGLDVGIDSTPTVLVNGSPVDGYDPASVRAAIDAAL